MRRPQAPTGCSLSERIAFHTGPRIQGGCRIWLGAKTEKGYGKVYHGGKANFKLYTVTRVLLAQKLKRPLKPGMEACHTCDRPSCVEVNHLFEGTRKDNQSDMARKGRSLRGERHNMVKLTATQVREIRKLLGRVSKKELAIRYSVSGGTIRHIELGKTWSHI